MIALVTRKGPNVISRTDNLLEALLQGAFDMTVEEKLRLFAIKKPLLRTIEHITSLLRHLVRMTEAILNDHDFIVPVATIVNNVTEKAVEVKAQREVRRSKFVEAVYTTDPWTASSSYRSQRAGLMNAQTRTFTRKTSEESTTELPQRN